MKPQPNSRQVPKVQEITAQKNYSDILYGYLQANSIKDEKTGERYIPKAEAKKVKIAEDLGMTRQTIGTRFKKLIELGLIKEETKRIVLVDIPANQAFLIPQETLRKLVNGLSANSITVYVYLFNRFIANKEKPFEFTLMALKTQCGLGTLSNSNNYIINDILEILATLGLIQYHIETSRHGDVTKTFLVLDKISHYVKKMDSHI